MPVFYKIDKERRLVMTAATGPFTLADTLDHQQRLVKDPDFEPTFCQLIDLSDITSFDVNAADIRILAQANLFSFPSRRAILITSDVGFGLARIFEVLREFAGETGIKIFRDLDEAFDWVLAKDRSAE
jgi:hypothetical protein